MRFVQTGIGTVSEEGHLLHISISVLVDKTTVHAHIYTCSLTYMCKTMHYTLQVSVYLHVYPSGVVHVHGGHVVQ